MIVLGEVLANVAGAFGGGGRRRLGGLDDRRKKKDLVTLENDDSLLAMASPSLGPL